MASSPMVHYMSSVSPHSPKCYHNNQTLALPHSNFLSPTSFLRLKRKTLFSNIQFNKPLAPRPLVYALQSNFFKVIQTVWKVGKDGVEAGTNLVPDSVPRPIARISVSVVALFVTLFVLKSFLSTAFFALATMGLVYFVFIALNKDQGPRGGSGSESMEDPVEEARKIMEKYK
ncbi:hypothetical protein ERO13_A07G201700v2 [Gossypium hirsutum]|uniref:Transmembrane protein n=4 Tax=Gossypium TaxID=3633 RepID=A0ABR0PG12_GOSAR|nr:uncharacterized protein LOC108481756 [Gossypium arboreum]XP_040972653.1 uncharacterized protein LOC121231846 [Gossypium hirsutum]TYI20401.1 hypothetical protein ES332_A07G235300v1 [Gossypium tomentosum]TYJ27996.1 hypothetical protein E1A91_A07G227600v1 [Gossypium mustelinum]KAG4193138.1 hypothetical protein ERO13_A07G201700v2 [Gossypium hirsutum]KAK5820157.1 hypothetical protein PVK06_025203 [Gossypium arboreum]